MKKISPELQDAINLLKEEMEQLKKWAKQSREGGWSTHQVTPMEKRALYLKNKVNEILIKALGVENHFL